MPSSTTIERPSFRMMMAMAKPETSCRAIDLAATPTIVGLRFPRAPGGPDGDGTVALDRFDPGTLGVPTDPTQPVQPFAKFTIEDLVEAGEFIYCLVSNSAGFREDRLDAPYWLVTLRRRPWSPSTTITGPDSQTYPYADVTTVLTGDPALAEALHIHHILPLSTAAHSQSEPARLFISPDHRWLLACTGNSVSGCFVIDAVDPADPAPAAQAGWRQEGEAEWFGLDVDQDQLEFPLDLVHTRTHRAGGGRFRVPVWPLSVIPDEDNVLFWVENNVSGNREPREAGEHRALLFLHAGGFFEADDDLYLVVNNGPPTIWKIDPHYDPDDQQGGPLLYVGAVCGERIGRLRIAQKAGDWLYMMGDLGGVAIPTCSSPTSGRCCVVE